ncbi:MAG: NAD(P)-binding protein [Prevotellaceae bacterium]|jgi:protoporphyrinogen oxidase|nr:NAD(P)-binding protein [Prevotellaceae bacterium]
MKNIAIIGAGISGLSIAHCLKNRFRIKVYEKDIRPGGLIKCNREEGHLYHIVGGHVFNSHRQDVLNWFWSFFDKEKEFVQASRNAIITMPNRQIVDYPIENHLYMLDASLIHKIINELLTIAKNGYSPVKNFEEFLRMRFGDTLFEIYFQPYNEKIWRTNLLNVPLSWLDGKLPMPTIEEIIYNNFIRGKDNKMVHSTFYYARHNGSQFLADRLAEGLDIMYNIAVDSIKREGLQWSVNGEKFDKIIFCGNIKDLPEIVDDMCLCRYRDFINNLEYHGTTTVLCEIEQNPYSWIYLPDNDYMAHRIICTGNFSPSNNANGKTTGTVEFTDELSKQDIDIQLSKMPFSPKYIAHRFTPYTYPVQSIGTRATINELKNEMKKDDFYLLGRFAEWEYYNMDAAMGAALDLNKQIIK